MFGIDKNDFEKQFFFISSTVLEIAMDNYGQHNVHLIEKIQNGLNDAYRINPCHSVQQSSDDDKSIEKTDSQQQ